jgi:hypothetical protein
VKINEIRSALFEKHYEQTRQITRGALVAILKPRYKKVLTRDLAGELARIRTEKELVSTPEYVAIRKMDDELATAQLSHALIALAQQVVAKGVDALGNNIEHALEQLKTDVDELLYDAANVVAEGKKYEEGK